MRNWKGHLGSLAVVAALSLGGAALLYGQQATNDSMSTHSDTGMTKHTSGKHHKSNKGNNGQGTTGALRTDTSGSSNAPGATNSTNPSSSSSSAGADTVTSGSKPPTGASRYYTPDPAWADEVRETN